MNPPVTPKPPAAIFTLDARDATPETASVEPKIAAPDTPKPVPILTLPDTPTPPTTVNAIVTGKQIGRASCRERVYVLV